MSTFQKVSLAVFATVFLVLGFTLLDKNDGNVGALQAQIPALNYWVSETATSGVVSISADARLLATSSTRQFALIQAGMGCSQGIWVSLANDKAATANNSIFVASSSILEISPNTTPYSGAIHAIPTSGTCNINVTAY